MRLDQNPSFRKVIVPWYDSETACLVVIVLMGLVILYAAAGMSVAQEDKGFQQYLWVPVTLMLLSGIVIFSISFRLVKRYLQRFSK